MKTTNLILILIILLISCTAEETYEPYTGDYKVVSFIADKAVDLNNDNTTSFDLVNEINTFGRNDLEIRPKENQSNKAKLVSIFLPKTWITFQYPGHPEGYVEFIDYGFGTSYVYKDRSFHLAEKTYVEAAYIDNVESNKNVTFTSDLTVVDATHLALSISKEYYDFTSEQWVRLDIDIMYEKSN